MKDEFKDDVNLVEGCIKKDLSSWHSFIKKYSALIFISIENRLKKYGYSLSCQDIEDIRQNVFASIWKDKKLKDVKNRENISYWLAIVSGNSAIAYIRKKQFQKQSKSISLFDKIGEKELADFIPSAELSPPDELTRNEISKRIDGAIESLPTKEKLIIKLNLIHDKKYKEIATILGIPTGTVSSYLKRAKEKLKMDLKDFL